MQDHGCVEVDVRGTGLGKAAVVGGSLGVLGLGLATRTATASLVTLGAGFAWKERLFIALAWLPKATVQVPSSAALPISSSPVPVWQAALGPLVLDAATEADSPPDIRRFGLTVRPLKGRAWVGLGDGIGLRSWAWQC